MNTTQITKRHLIQLRLKLDNLKKAVSKKFACNRNHSTQCHKYYLNENGDGKINWIKKWLTDRRQHIAVDGEVSK